MAQDLRPLTAKEMREVREVLRKGRNHYEDKLLEVERIWARLKPTDYKDRKQITNLVPELIDLDLFLRTYEDKLR
jgi:hypothetical protein